MTNTSAVWNTLMLHRKCRVPIIVTHKVNQAKQVMKAWAFLQFILLPQETEIENILYQDRQLKMNDVTTQTIEGNS